MYIFGKKHLKLSNAHIMQPHFAEWEYITQHFA